MSTLTRRSALGLAASLAGLALAAPAAFAAGSLTFPLRLAYARIGRDGFVSIRSAEASVWEQMQVRTGGLIETLEPIQPTSMLGSKPPDVDGGASCALAARALAGQRGFTHVILYATTDGHGEKAGGDGWISRSFAAIRGLGEQRSFGEAHLLDVMGGDPVISATADSPPRSWINPFDDHRRPERETLTALTMNLERSLQAFARDAFREQGSIAD